MGGGFTYPKMGSQNGVDNHGHMSLVQTEHISFRSAGAFFSGPPNSDPSPAAWRVAGHGPMAPRSSLAFPIAHPFPTEAARPVLPPGGKSKSKPCGSGETFTPRLGGGLERQGSSATRWSGLAAKKKAKPNVCSPLKGSKPQKPLVL